MVIMKTQITGTLLKCITVYILLPFTNSVFAQVNDTL